MKVCVLCSCRARLGLWWKKFYSYRFLSSTFPYVLLSALFCGFSHWVYPSFLIGPFDRDKMLSAQDRCTEGTELLLVKWEKKIKWKHTELRSEQWLNNNFWNNSENMTDFSGVALSGRKNGNWLMVLKIDTTWILSYVSSRSSSTNLGPWFKIVCFNLISIFIIFIYFGGT